MIDKLYENIEKVILGKRAVIENIIVALLADGHVLLEDVPGVGKTTLAKAIASSFDASFSRIQFTTDLLPSDILGVSIYNTRDNIFEFKKGPIFNQIILSDEINRATPKTQSSLLEAMEEKQITIDGREYKLQEPFFVLATQNPIEYKGTFALPQAQLDRFIMKLKIGYLSEYYEVKIFDKIENESTVEKLEPVMTTAELKEIKKKVKDVFVTSKIKHYIYSIISKTRAHEDIVLGCSPRASIALYKTAKAKAFLQGRDYVIPDDIRGIASNVLAHRLVITEEAKYRGESSESIFKNLLKRIKVPKVENYDRTKE